MLPWSEFSHYQSSNHQCCQPSNVIFLLITKKFSFHSCCWYSSGCCSFEPSYGIILICSNYRALLFVGSYTLNVVRFCKIDSIEQGKSAGKGWRLSLGFCGKNLLYVFQMVGRIRIEQMSSMFGKLWTNSRGNNWCNCSNHQTHGEKNENISFLK